MKCVKSSLKHAEEVKKEILSLGILSHKYKIVKDKYYVYFPITKRISGFEIVEKKLPKKIVRLSFEEVLRKKFTKEEFTILSKSYDIIGNIAVLEINDEFLKNKRIIAEALIQSNKNIKTVVRKVGEHKGQYRVQDYELLAGEKNFETLHKENSIFLKLNISKVYYSPRSANERLRIAISVKAGENVLVMFSGIGVYPFVIAKYSKANEIYGVEINPDACSYADYNLELNKLRNVKLLCGDVNKIVPSLNKKFDRIIMPLPSGSMNFLDLALKFLNRNGIIHLYYFSSEENVDSVVEGIKKKCKCKILNIIKAGQQSPKIYRYCIDFIVS